VQEGRWTTDAHLGYHLSPSSLAHAIAQWGMGYALAASLFLMAVQTFLPFIPFFILTGANVLVFGFWPGSLLNYLGAFLGDSVAYWVFRRYGRGWALRWVRTSARERWEGYFRRRRGFLLVVLSRLMPVIPAGLVNIAAALADMDYPSFALATLLGNAPASVLNGLLGHDIFTFGQNKVHLLQVVGVFAFLSLAGELWLRLSSRDGQAPPAAGRSGKGAGQEAHPPAPRRARSHASHRS
jgi:uncharacterized membrane protein YdjX (TVP38/TMEM64 family)